MSDVGKRRSSILQPFLLLREKSGLFSKAPNSAKSRKQFNWNKIFSVLKYWPEFLIFSLAVAGAVACFYVLRLAEYNNADATFTQQAGDRATVLVWELDRVQGDLMVVTSYISVSLEWKEDYFRDRFKNVTSGILSRSPGTQALEWIPMVADPSERAFLEDQQARQLGLGGSLSEMRNSSSGKLERCIYYKNAAGTAICSPATPVGGPFQAAGPQYPHAFYPVYFAEPVNDPTGFRSSNAAAIMYDLGSNTARNTSLSTAILKNAPSATARLTLVQETASQFGMLVFIPVYQSLPCSQNPASNCQTLAGLTTAVFRITDLVLKSQKGLIDIDARIRGDQFLLDLGNAQSATGFIGATIFFPGSDCSQLADYSDVYGITELYASTNATANAPVVQQRLSQILPSICSVVQQDGNTLQQLTNTSGTVTFSGLDGLGAFYVSTFLVADRRWMFVVHTDGYAYRDLLSTKSPPIILAVGILLATILMVGSFLFRMLQSQMANNAFLMAFRGAKAGDKATQQHLPPAMMKDYVAVDIMSKGASGCVVGATRKQGGEAVAIKIVVPEQGRFKAARMRQLEREAKTLMALAERRSEHAVRLAGVGAFHLRAALCWFVTEREQGNNLDVALRNDARGPLTDGECIRMARQVGSRRRCWWCLVAGLGCCEGLQEPHSAAGGVQPYHAPAARTVRASRRGARAASPQILKALGMLHADGLIHRDVRPANILRCRSTKSDKALDVQVRPERASASGEVRSQGAARGAVWPSAPRAAV